MSKVISFVGRLCEYLVDELVWVFDIGVVPMMVLVIWAYVGHEVYDQGNWNWSLSLVTYVIAVATLAKIGSSAYRRYRYGQNEKIAGPADSGPKTGI